VFHGLFTSTSFEDCLVKIVNLGGDADTTGAIAGMLAGAAYGEAAVPYRWLRRLDAGVRAAASEQALRLLALGSARSALGSAGA
jgi:ADP-ribosyl-[dinitrogen reductase] hydrolase